MALYLQFRQPASLGKEVLGDYPPQNPVQLVEIMEALWLDVRVVQLSDADAALYFSVSGSQWWRQSSLRSSCFNYTKASYEIMEVVYFLVTN